MQTLQTRTFALGAVALAAVLLASGCEKKRETVSTPAGTTTTTTVTPTPSANQAMGSASQAMSNAGDAIGDAAITAKVKTALLADPDVKGLKVDVDTKDGVVTLTGNADNKTNLDRAAVVAKGIDGVKSVDNKLEAK